MLSLFRQAGRQKGLSKRRSRRKRRVAKIVAPAVITTALLISIISGLTDDPANSDTTANGSTSASSIDSGTTTISGSGGGTTSGADSGSGSSSTSATAGTSGSGGSSTTGSGSSTGTVTGDGSTSGDLSGLVLAFEEDPASGTASDPAMDPITAGTEVTVTGSAFDEYPLLDLVTIEEDWELIVTEPDAALGAPHVGTSMTPFEDAADFYLAFVVNQRFNPTYSAGGMELQLWYQGAQLGWLTFGETVLCTPNETIKWTQRLELKQSKLRFSVVKGNSTTWGDFGAGESMHLELATTLTDLNDYHPNVSAENSGVVFASNRVGSLSLKKVRGYDKNGVMVLQDTHPVVVFAQGQ